MSIDVDTSATVFAVSPITRSRDVAFLATQSGLYRITTSDDTRSLIDGSTALTTLATHYSHVIAGGMGGFLVSDDGGDTWAVVATDTPPSLITSIAIIDERTMLAGTLEDGVLRSDDGGKTWEPSSAGLFDFGVDSIATSPESDVVLLGTEHGVYLSTTRGRYWNDLPVLDACAPATVATMSLDFANDQVLAVGSDRGDIALSRDQGITWDHIGADPLFANSLELILVPTSDQPRVLVVTPEGIIDGMQKTALWQESTIVASAHSDGRLTLVTEEGSLRSISLSDL
jgi:photosystem II stability/assembly factor-like uncharacterized protein